MVVNLLICIFGIPIFVLCVLMNELKILSGKAAAHNLCSATDKFRKEVCDDELYNKLNECFSFDQSYELTENCKKYFPEMHERFMRENKDKYDFYIEHFQKMKNTARMAEKEMGLKEGEGYAINLYMATLGKIKGTFILSQKMVCPFGFGGNVKTREPQIKWIDKKITEHHPEYFLYAFRGDQYVYKWNFVMNRSDYLTAYRLNE